ncbi:tetratricopeptide repeat protein [Fidelibacter multiformis]|uniref:tetratricopeptide repeat protein n=1 Tax=Fidelibacter multiformis TaxID=3377529 RepID=UPI0037DD0814
MKFLCFICSLTCFATLGFSQDPMLDMDMLFPERTARQDSAMTSRHTFRTDTGESVSLEDLLKRIERLEEEFQQLKEALEEKQPVTEKKQDDPGIPLIEQQLYARALRHFTAGEYGKASELLRQVRDNTQEKELNLSALYWLGECAFRQDNYNEAVVLLQELLSEESEVFRENALILLAVSFRNLGKQAESNRYFQTYLKAYPESRYSALARKELQRSQ